MEAVAFIGLGTMGTPMCRNIMKGGHPLYVYNRSQDKSALLVQEGARRLESPADAFTKAKIVITMLSNDSALEEVTCGPHGLLESIQPGSIHVSMSTVSPAVSTKLHALHEKKGAHFLAAPVFGRPEAAIHARLYIALSGNSAAKKEALPILQLLGQRVEDFGEAIESAAIMKLAGNFMVLSAIETLGEAMQLAAKSGVANEQFINFFTETIFASPIYKTYGKLIASEGPRPVGLTMKLALKDITLANEAAASHVLPMPFGELLKKLMQTRVEAGQGDLDWSMLGVH